LRIATPDCNPAETAEASAGSGTAQRDPGFNEPDAEMDAAGPDEMGVDGGPSTSRQ
jgi:hypothetical protein